MTWLWQLPLGISFVLFAGWLGNKVMHGMWPETPPAPQFDSGMTREERIKRYGGYFGTWRDSR